MNDQSLLAGVIAPLVEHPYRGPWLKTTSPSFLSEPIEVLADRFCRALGPAHPNVKLATSWAAVAQGSEAFEEDTLATLRLTEPVIREHFPQARRALALNLAAQGCHAWFIESDERALAPLTEAFGLITAAPLVAEADVLKVSEVLSDSLRKVGSFDEALRVLARGYPYFLAGREQDRWLAGQYDEWRSEFVEVHGGDCSPHLKPLLDVLAGDKLCAHLGRFEE